MLKILRAGIYTTVQDLGRNGFRRLGVSQGGALDEPALRIANLLPPGWKSPSGNLAPNLPGQAGSR